MSEALEGVFTLILGEHKQGTALQQGVTTFDQGPDGNELLELFPGSADSYNNILSGSFFTYLVGDSSPSVHTLPGAALASSKKHCLAVHIALELQECLLPTDRFSLSLLTVSCKTMKVTTQIALGD